MSGGQGGAPRARRPPRSGGAAGGTLPADGFTYVGGERRLDNHLRLNNGSLRSLPDDKNDRSGVSCSFQRNLEPRYSRKQQNGYLRTSDTVLGLARLHRERERERERDYSEPEYSVIPEYRREECPRTCAHSNTFNC